MNNLLHLVWNKQPCFTVSALENFSKEYLEIFMCNFSKCFLKVSLCIINCHEILFLIIVLVWYLYSQYIAALQARIACSVLANNLSERIFT